MYATDNSPSKQVRARGFPVTARKFRLLLERAPSLFLTEKAAPGTLKERRGNCRGADGDGDTIQYLNGSTWTTVTGTGTSIGGSWYLDDFPWIVNQTRHIYRGPGFN
jgi:hypothetical protein